MLRSRVAIASVGFMFGALLALSCSDEAKPANSADAGDAEDPQAIEQEVLDACLGFADKLCDSARDCCIEAYGEQDHDACVEGFRRDVCQPGAAAVREGLAIFNADSVEACLAAHAELHDRCTVDWADILELRKLLWSSCNVIDGTFDEGDGCSTDLLCAKEPGATAALCRSGVCRVLRILDEGDECPFPDGDVSVCDAGLYCTAEGLGETGTCEQATATGEACEPVELNPACGLGSFCNMETEQCEVAAASGGESCTQHDQCVSFSCNRVIGQCDGAPAAVPRDLCTGE